jgi:hypothetical protein
MDRRVKKEGALIKRPRNQAPRAVYPGLRRQVFESTPETLGLTIASESKAPWAILMEMGYPTAVVTLASFATGDASLYFSSGGGILGGGYHQPVHDAAKRFVATAEDYVDKMALVTLYPVPELGRVRFYVLTRQGVFTSEAREQDLGAKKNELASLFYAGQDVITELRLVSEKKLQ